MPPSSESGRSSLTTTPRRSVEHLLERDRTRGGHVLRRDHGAERGDVAQGRFFVRREEDVAQVLASSGPMVNAADVHLAHAAVQPRARASSRCHR